MRFTVQLDDAADKLRLIEMTDDPTNQPNKWRGEQSSTAKPDDYVPWTIRDEPAHWPMDEGQGDTLNPDTHAQLVDLRHELAELRELQRSASCQRGWLVAAIALLFVGLVALGLVLV